jgi:hypothetical protein
MLVSRSVALATGAVDTDRLAWRLGTYGRLSACAKASRQMGELRQIEDVDDLVKRKKHARRRVVGRSRVFVLGEPLA